MEQFFDIVKAIFSGFLIFVQFCVEGLAALISWFSSALGLGWSEGEVGLITGAILAGFLGFIVFRVTIWWRAVTLPLRPQVVVHTTARTPSQVTSGSFTTLMMGILLVALMFGVFWLIG